MDHILATTILYLINYAIQNLNYIYLDYTKFRVYIFVCAAALGRAMAPAGPPLAPPLVVDKTDTSCLKFVFYIFRTSLVTLFFKEFLFF
jgi:hypothetical protein